MQYWLYAELVSVGISVDETFVTALTQSEKQALSNENVGTLVYLWIWVVFPNVY